MSNAPVDLRLVDLQSGFQDFILQRNDRVLARVESTAALSAERRLDIYYQAYRLRLIDVLADTFERVALYIGEESFEAAARAYLEQQPSAVRNLRDYGISFPAFLARYFAADPEVAELADMDLRLRHAFDGVDADVLRVADLAAIQPSEWDDVVFTLHPTASVQTFRWNTPTLWQHLSNEQTPPPVAALPQPVAWLFWRKELQPHFRSLSREEHHALQALRDGRTFGAICASLAEIFPELDVTTHVGGWLRTWLDDGVLSGYRLGT